MILLRQKLPGILGALLLASGLAAIGATDVSASSGPQFTCLGGDIPPGTYKSISVVGTCSVSSGNVQVEHDVTIQPGGGLNAAFAGSDLTVRHDLRVGAGGLLFLGCEPEESPCFNDPEGQTNHVIGHDVITADAILVVVHRSQIGGHVRDSGGGGGFSCNEVFPGGPPPFTDYTDNTIGGNVTVTGLRTCWDGFLRNTVAGSVTWSDNQTAIEDGNLMGTNTIRHNLSCFSNSPLPHLADEGPPVPNMVGGHARGQCAPLSIEGR